MRDSPRTTLAGIGAIVAAVGAAIAAWPNPDWAATVTAVMAGLGLIFAKDSKGAGA